MTYTTATPTKARATRRTMPPVDTATSTAPLTGTPAQAPLTKAPARYPIKRALVAAYEEYATREAQAHTQAANAAHLAVQGVQSALAREAAHAQFTAPVVATPTVSILTALDTALSAIRATHSDVPTALAVVISTGMGKKHGSFQADSWADTVEGVTTGARHELLMASESLSRGAEATLTTLIHEAGHALAHATGVKDTSRQGRYHGSKFRTIAESMGLTCEDNETSGTITTGLTEWAKAHYAAELELLASVLVTARKPVDKSASKKTTIRIVCGCEMPLTVPIKWWDDFGADNLTCELCEGAHFEAVTE